MAVNILEMLKQIQRDLADQKEYTRNLHIINRNLNEKLNRIEERTTDLPKILVTIERLEQQVKQNNMVLFGSDETEDSLQKTIMPYKPVLDDKEKAISFGGNVEQTIEITEVLDSFKTVLDEERESNNEEDIKNSDSYVKLKNCTGESEGNIKKEVEKSLQPIRDVVALGYTSTGQSSSCPLCKQDAAKVSDSNLKPNEINMLDEKLSKITDLYQSDMKGLIDSMNKIDGTIKTYFEAKVSTNRQEPVDTSLNMEVINQITDEFKRVTDKHQSETREIKKLIEDFLALSRTTKEDSKNVVEEKANEIFTTCTDLKLIAENNQSKIKELMKYFVANKLPVEARTAGKQETVQIAPTYFSPYQIRKLNDELTRIAKKYKGTNMCPIIEVKQGAGEESDVMKRLRDGVYFSSLSDSSGRYKVKLGLGGFKRADIIDMITENPCLKVNEVVQEWMESKNMWSTWSQKYKISPAYTYDAYRGRYEPF